MRSQHEQKAVARVTSAARLDQAEVYETVANPFGFAVAPSTVPIVPSVRHAGVRGCAAKPGLGKAMPHATISLELSSTGLRVASREASGLWLDVVFVIVFIWMPFAASEGPQGADLPLPRAGAYA
jgi:hypothetical protein